MTYDQLVSLINSQINDNTTGQITPAKERNVLQNIVAFFKGYVGWAQEFDASVNTFPSGTFNATNEVKITVAGTIDGIDVYAGDILKAMQDSPTSDWNPLTGWRKI